MLRRPSILAGVLACRKSGACRDVAVPGNKKGDFDNARYSCDIPNLIQPAIFAVPPPPRGCIPDFKIKEKMAINHRERTEGGKYRH